MAKEIKMKSNANVGNEERESFLGLREVTFFKKEYAKIDFETEVVN